MLKEVFMFGCQSFFENPSVVMNSKSHNIYQLFGFETMHVFDLGISRELKNVWFADWKVKFSC